ncbi:MAG: GNAT family N-acetyltransferase [Pseudomonadota bacterium]
MMALETDWCDLERRTSQPFTFFQTFDWCSNWIKHGDASGQARPLIIVIRNTDRLIALCPLMRLPLAGGQYSACILGHPHTQYANMLIDDHAPRPEVNAIFRRALRGISGVDMVELNEVPASSRLAAALDSMARPVFTDNATAIMNFRGLSTWEDYQASLNCSIRRGRAKRRNKLERAGDVTFDVLWPCDPGFDEAVTTVIEMKRQWIAATGRVGTGLEGETLSTFLAHLTGDASLRAGLVLHVLKLDNRPIAIELGIIRGDDYASFIAGFDGALNDLSPGKIQMERSFRWFLENGVVRYDFLPNPASYKAGWTNESETVVTFSIPLNMTGRLLAFVSGAATCRRVKNLFYALPAPIRKRIMQARQVVRRPSLGS